MKYTLETIKEKIVVSTLSYNDISCWLWKGTFNTNQYVMVSHNGTQTSLHRLVYTLEHGVIPIKGVIYHLCGNKGCCNPAHLELVTHSENIRRAFERKPRVKKENTREQITVTLEPDHIKYVKAIAAKLYEGNDSMAFRKIIADHSRLVSLKESN